MHGVDLRHADIHRSIRIAVCGAGIEIALDLQDGLEHPRIDLVVIGSGANTRRGRGQLGRDARSGSGGRSCPCPRRTGETDCDKEEEHGPHRDPCYGPNSAVTAAPNYLFRGFGARALGILLAVRPASLRRGEPQLPSQRGSQPPASAGARSRDSSAACNIASALAMLDSPIRATASAAPTPGCS